MTTAVRGLPSSLTRAALRFCYRMVADERDAERVLQWTRDSKWSSSIAGGLVLERAFRVWLMPLPQQQMVPEASGGGVGGVMSVLEELFALLEMFAYAPKLSAHFLFGFDGSGSSSGSGFSTLIEISIRHFDTELVVLTKSFREPVNMKKTLKN